MILFLDFDGVLHPVGNRISGETDFAKLPLLEDWLRQHQYVQIVISSSWRQAMDLEDLRHLFSADLRDRVIDACPVIPSNPEPIYWRHDEIMAWIVKSGYTGHWLALDDAGFDFPDDFEQLVLCDRSIGIDESVIAELTAKSARDFTEGK